MTDREKEALDYITGQMKCGYIDISNTYPDEFEFNIIKEAIDLYKKKEEIEKQQSELETLKRDFEIVDHECIRLEREDVRKDMIIDLMSEEIVEESKININSYKYINMDKEEVKQYFERKVEKC